MQLKHSNNLLDEQMGATWSLQYFFFRQIPKDKKNTKTTMHQKETDTW